MFGRYLLPFTLLMLILAGCISRSDAMAPRITIVEPASGTTQSAEKLVVRGYAMDDSGIKSIRVGINNAESDLLAADQYKNEKGKKLINFAFSVNQVGDQFAANIVVDDILGRSTTLPYTIIIDNIKPTIEITSVTDLGNSRLQVVGVARDNDKVKSIVIAGQALSFIAQAEQRFDQDIDVTETMTLEVTDSAGNTESIPIQ